MPQARCYILPTILSLTCSGMLCAQDYPPTDWQPVDQTVADLDLRASSSRYVEQGIGVFGQSGTLYRRPDSNAGWVGQGQPLSQQYQLRQPGYTAYIDQPDYLVIDQQGQMNLNVAPSADQTFQNLTPPNTVFDLVYHPQTATPAFDTWFDLGLGNTLMSTRVDGGVAGEVTGESAIQLLPPMPVAHSLPPHLVRERERRAAQALQATDQAEVESEEVREDADTVTPAP